MIQHKKALVNSGKEELSLCTKRLCTEPGSGRSFHLPSLVTPTSHQGGIQVRCQTTLTDSFWCGGVATLRLAPLKWAPHCITKADPRYPTEEAQFHSSYLQCDCSGHYPKLVAMAEGLGIYLPVNLEPSFQAHLCFH